MLDPGAAYGRARERVDALLDGVDAADECRPVPACPGWDVHDLVAHVVGVVEDALAGRMDGVTTDPWTAAQVVRGRTRPLADLRASWAQGAALFAGALADVPQGRLAVVDALTHEHDLRGALGRPGARDHADVAAASAWLAERRAGQLGGVRFELEGGPTFGATDASLVVRAAPWELLRALVGRRSVAQLRALVVGGGAGDDALRGLVVFGPAGADLVE